MCTRFDYHVTSEKISEDTKLGDGPNIFPMSVFLLRYFLHSDVLQERNYGNAQELSGRLFLSPNVCR